MNATATTDDDDDDDDDDDNDNDGVVVRGSGTSFKVPSSGPL